jgi:hypothetical protein
MTARLNTDIAVMNNTTAGSKPAVITITNDFHQQRPNTTAKEGFETGGDELSTVVLHSKRMTLTLF